MRAMFKVTYRRQRDPGCVFTSETVVSKSAVEAIQKADKKAAPYFKTEPGLFLSDVELLGVES